MFFCTPILLTYSLSYKSKHSCKLPALNTDKDWLTIFRTKSNMCMNMLTCLFDVGVITMME